MNTIIAKLITGEYIIGQQSKDYIQNCYTIMMIPSGNGQMGMSLVPYMMPFEKEGSDIDNKYIICTTETPEEIEKAYIEATSGIIIPKSKLTI